MRNTTTRLGPWIRRFLLEHLVHERNLARNTQRSYRDTLALLAPFASDHARVSVDRLAVEHLSPDLVRQFLHAITVTRDCSPATCNQRLAAIRAFARFVGRHSPEHIEWSGHICDIPFRKCAQAPVTYLEKPEIDALLAAPDRSTPQGRRDHVVLLFLYNTGARADEAAQLTVGDLELGDHGYASVRIRGKGNKIRHCPLWSRTVTELRALTRGRARTERVGRIPDFPEQCVGKRWTVRLGEVEPVFGQTGRVVLDITARTAHDGALKWTRAPSTPRAARSIFATFPSTCALPSGGRWSLRRVLQRPGRQRKRSSAKSSCGPSRTSSSAPSSPPCCNARYAPPRLATRRAPSCATCPGGCGATAWRPSTFAPPGARRCRSRRRTTARNTPVGRSGGRDSTP